MTVKLSIAYHILAAAFVGADAADLLFTEVCRFSTPKSTPAVEWPVPMRAAAVSFPDVIVLDREGTLYHFRADGRPPMRPPQEDFEAASDASRYKVMAADARDRAGDGVCMALLKGHVLVPHGDGVNVFRAAAGLAEAGRCRVAEGVEPITAIASDGERAYACTKVGVTCLAFESGMLRPVSRLSDEHSRSVSATVRGGELLVVKADSHREGRYGIVAFDVSDPLHLKRSEVRYVWNRLFHACRLGDRLFGSTDNFRISHSEMWVNGVERLGQTWGMVLAFSPEGKGPPVQTEVTGGRLLVPWNIPGRDPMLVTAGSVMAWDGKALKQVHRFRSVSHPDREPYFGHAEGRYAVVVGDGEGVVLEMK